MPNSRRRQCVCGLGDSRSSVDATQASQLENAERASVPILIDQTKRVLVQGITGREGLARTRLMLDYGTLVVGGCTPGKGGTNVLGVPVFDSVRRAIESLGKIDISV